MTNKNTRKFTSSDDALILQQPVSGVGLNTLAKMIRTSREAIIRRAGELGVSLDISNDHDDAADTRVLRTAEAGTRRPEVNHMFAFALFGLAHTHRKKSGLPRMRRALTVR
jgi:hypothetical protein